MKTLTLIVQLRLGRDCTPELSSSLSRIAMSECAICGIQATDVHLVTNAGDFYHIRRSCGLKWRNAVSAQLLVSIGVADDRGAQRVDVKLWAAAVKALRRWERENAKEGDAK